MLLCDGAMALVLEIPDLPIRLTARGEWLHGTEPVHPRVATLFARSVVPEPGGTYRLEVGRARAPVDVADTAYFVTRLILEPSDGPLEGIALELSDGARERLDPHSLMRSLEHVLYCRIVRHGLSVPCRFPPSLYHRLALHVEEDPQGFVLPLGGARHPIGPYDPHPVTLP